MNKYIKNFLNGSLLALALSGCSDSPEVIETADPIETPDEEEVVEIERPTISELSLNDNEKLANNCLNDFGLRFFKKAYDLNYITNKNFIVSPISASIGLAMLTAGADDMFREKALEVIGCSDPDALNSTARQLMMYLPDKQAGCEITLANNVWHDLTISPRDDFRATMQEYYFTNVNPLDFTAPASADIINQWVSSQTNGLFNAIINPQQLQPLRLMEVNALYFKGAWARKFDKSKTCEGDFTTDTGEKVKVEFMHKSEEMVYCRTSSAEWVFVPYGDWSYSLMLALPAENVSISQFLEDLKSKWLSMHAKDDDELKTTICSVSVSVPKFKIETKINCEDVFDAMGIDPSSSYENLANEDNLETATILINHAAKIDVDEDGAVGAAFTANGWCLSPGDDYEPEHAELILDRPFVFIVNNNHTGTIVFAGVVNNL